MSTVMKCCFVLCLTNNFQQNQTFISNINPNRYVELQVYLAYHHLMGNKLAVTPPTGDIAGISALFVPFAIGFVGQR